MLPHPVFEALFQASPNPYVIVAPDLTIVAANDAYLELMQMEREEMVGHDVFDVFPGNPDDPDDPDVRRVRASFERVLEERAPVSLPIVHYTIPIQTPEGQVYKERYWSSSHTPIFDEHGEVRLILHDVVEVTELQQLKQRLRGVEDGRAARADDDASVDATQIEGSVLRRAEAMQEINLMLDAEREHLHRLFDQAPGFVCFQRGPEHVFELVNMAYDEVTGHRDVLGKPAREALPEVEGQGYFELLDRVYETGEPFVGQEMEAYVQRTPGEEPERIYVDFVYQPVLNEDGSVYGIFTQGYEVTDRRRATEELRRYQERLEELVRERTRELQESEAALRHSQKMEAVGKLTGGVAHDFNNLLQIIAGNLQLLQRDLGTNETAQRRLDTALRTVERGAKLSTQLLAFARRQPLEPRAINPGELVRSMQELLHRALGEMITIQTAISEELWNVFADANQLENVILNLAINARDAMDGEGMLKIEADNRVVEASSGTFRSELAPGEYVCVTISDSGVGMSEDVKERAFEPFFTTKTENGGTGLGLSMAYGFVKQSGGHIKIRSREGGGTSVEIFLPRTLEEAQEDIDIPQSGPIEGGNETILVVEDDLDVLATVVAMLSDLGFRVLKASDGESALAILRSGVHVDLLFTDVIVPGPVASTDVAKEATRLLPNLEVLFTSGYAEDTIVHQGRLDPGVHLLSKPYTREDLARRIRYMLRNREQRIAARDPEDVEISPDSPRAEAMLQILLVEDDETIQEFVSELVSELGHRVVAVPSAEEALSRFDDDENDFDVLFTDITLAGMSGIELAQTLSDRRPGLHIIIASGYGEHIETEGEAGVPGAIMLPKPYDAAQVDEVLERLQGRGRS